MKSAFLIDPYKSETTEVLYKNDSADDVRRLIKLKPDEVFDYFPIQESGDLIYLDDNGLYNLKKKRFYIDGYRLPLAGYGLVVGVTRGGHDTKPKIKLERLKEIISFS